MTTETSWKYFYEANPNRNHPPYAMGTSQCYLKSWWEKHKFPEDPNTVEDFGFQQAALHAGQLDSCDAEQLCVARAHKGSKGGTAFGHAQWPQVERTALPEEFFADMARKHESNPDFVGIRSNTCLTQL